MIRSAFRLTSFWRWIEMKHDQPIDETELLNIYKSNLDAANEEVKRLRAALREIADIPNTPLNGRLCQNLAKEALGE